MSVAFMYLRDIKGVVEGEYPFPVSQVFRRCQMTRESDAAGRHKGLVELFEASIRFIVIVALQEANDTIPNLKNRLPLKDKAFDFLRRPSMGHWVGMLRDLCSIPEAKDHGSFLPGIRDWFLEPADKHTQELLKAINQVVDVGVGTRGKYPMQELCGAMVAIRNKRTGHGSLPMGEQLAEYNRMVEHAVAHLLHTAEFLKGCRLYYVEQRTLDEHDQWQFDLQELNGLGAERVQLVHDDKLEAKELYLAEGHDKGFQGCPVKLSPFLLWLQNDDQRRFEIFFYNGALKTKLEYHAFSSGAFYYHKELHRDFKRLIQLELSPSESHDSILALSREERTLKGDDYYKRAVVNMERDRFEDALELVEAAIEYERRPVFFLLKAKAEHALHEDDSLVEQTLALALELDPEFSEAKAMLAMLVTSESESRPGNEEGLALGLDEDVLEAPTLFHALTPRRIRQYSLAWWLALVAAWYGVSIYLECLRPCEPRELVGMVGIVIACLVFAVGLPTVRLVTLAMKLPLSLQLENMRLSRFVDEWYPERMKEIYGPLRFSPPREKGRVCVNDRFMPWASIRSEPHYYVLFLVFFLAVWSLILTASGSLEVPKAVLVKRGIDYAILVFMLVPCIRFILMSTKFVLEFSKLSIKPMLTRINDDGLRSFGPFLSYNIFLATAANTGFFLCASFMNTGPLWGDFPILAIISVVVMCWSIGMPYTIYRAAKSAKFNAVHAYAQHIEDGFRAFLKEPEESTLEKYRWLLANQKVITGISNWPLSLLNTLVFVFGANVVLVSVNVWFVFKRTGNAHLLEQWARNLFFWH